MDREPVELDSLNKKELTALHNTIQQLLGRDTSHDLVQEFTTVQSALTATEMRLTELSKMYKHIHVLWAQDKGVILYASDKPHIDATPRNTNITTLDLKLKLIVVAEKNPKRVTTRAGKIFELYAQNDCGETGEDFVRFMVRAGYTRRLALSTLHWDIRHGFVKLGEE